MIQIYTLHQPLQFLLETMSLQNAILALHANADFGITCTDIESDVLFNFLRHASSVRTCYTRDDTYIGSYHMVQMLAGHSIVIYIQAQARQTSPNGSINKSNRPGFYSTRDLSRTTTNIRTRSGGVRCTCGRNTGQTVPLQEKAKAPQAATAPNVATVAVRATAETTRIARLRFGAGTTRSFEASTNGGTGSSASMASRFLFRKFTTCNTL